MTREEEHLLEDIDTLRNYIEANNIEVSYRYVEVLDVLNRAYDELNRAYDKLEETTATWITHNGMEFCSNCHMAGVKTHKYCHECGAQMV